MRILPSSFLLPILFCYLCLCSHVFVVSCFCVEDQQSLLLQLKNNDFKFQSLQASKLVSWNQNLSYCDWSGITCDMKGHVIGLDLSSEGILEALNNSSALFCLQYLQNLDLSDNDFNSSIPPAIRNLKNLTSLNLSYNNFQGQIPVEISQLTRLISLDLSSSSSSLKLENPNLQKLVQKLTNIRRLYLDRVNISSQGQEWSKALFAMLALEELSMQGCSLFGPISSSLQKLQNLSKIYLDYNDLSSTVPESFANFKKLIILSLHYCNLRGIFPQKVLQLATLSSIILSYNDNLQVSLPHDFPLNGSLEILQVSDTKFSAVIPNSISNLMHLSMVDLSYCQLTGTFPISLLNVTKLSSLDLSNNNFIGPVPPLFELPFLQTVRLSFNHFDGEIKFNMPRTPQQYLETLDLSYNKLSIGVNVMDANFSSFPNLTNLGLASCNLREFPIFLRNHSIMVDYLDLSYNQIQGLIPHWIWELVRFGTLNLSMNSLTGFEGSMHNVTVDLDVLHLHSSKLHGQIPPFISSLFLDYSNNNFNSVIPYSIDTQISRSMYLFLAKNQIHGHIPHSLCNLTVLDLSNNRLEGTIPSCLIQSETLELLNLGNNMLSGNIPNAFPESCTIYILDMYGNQLSGLIPESIINCKELEVLNLGNNQISGHFLCLLKNISSLQVMILRQNQLQGTIGCLDNNGTWPALQIFDFAFNNFSGFLRAKAFTAWEAMMHVSDQYASYSNYIQLLFFGDMLYFNKVTIMSKGQDMELDKILIALTVIDFSSNNFKGPIPKELMSLEVLHVLNLSNNAFSGQIPSFIGNMKQLESLDLSRNSLIGEIPTELASLSFLEFLNLSFNHPVGRIPTGTQLQSFEASSFQGNDGLHGPPLTEIPKNGKHGPMPPPTPGNYHGIDFKFITGMEFGVVFGLAIIIGPLFFWKQWKIRYWKCVDNVLCSIFPQLYLDYQRHEGQWHAVLRWNR